METASKKPRAKNSKFEIQNSKFPVGSALILTVVLTSLLAIVGVLFVMVARVDKIATSAISENKELNFAVETVVAKISGELVLDVPGLAGQEYYDYPDVNNLWLANLEPYRQGGDYYWWQISDVYDRLGAQAQALQAEIIPDYQDVAVMAEGLCADADGDGVADSRWVIVPDITSGKGKPIYAAVRIVDNSAMLNVNTACKFDPCDSSVANIDGSSQMQINLAAFSERGDENGTLATAANKLQAWRCGTVSNDLSLYEQNVVWRYGDPNGAYTPFDISDELKLRNRYIVNYNLMTCRIEELWESAYDSPPYVPLNKRQHSTDDPNYWFWYVNNLEPNKYDYRHISTIYNMDRIINPRGSTLNNGKMANVNTDSKDQLHRAIRQGILDGDFPYSFQLADTLAAQITANLIDFRDPDSDVTTVLDANGVNFYGFECPCIYISELDYNAVTVGDPPITYKSYAAELYKPYSEDAIPGPGLWQLVIDGTAIGVDSWPAGKDFYVIQNQDPVAIIDVDANAVIKNSAELAFAGNSEIKLQRYVAQTAKYITVDSNRVPDWLVEGDGVKSFQRDISEHKCIRRLWNSSSSNPTLGSKNIYIDNIRPEKIQAHPYLEPTIYQDKGFKNIGEIGMILTKSAYSEDPTPIGPSDTEVTVRLDLSNPVYQQIFNYLTVFPPAEYAQDPNETRIKGRVNINTASWFVIAQLPWVSAHTPNYELARAIVERRDTVGAFKSIGELNLVGIGDPSPLRSIGYYARTDGPGVGDQLGFPDLTAVKPFEPGDGAPDDFEERDVIFARISNLVTVRSDVFTAYILVRIGADGPQKRAVAILDRSNVNSGNDKVRIVALHPVPDPR